MWESHHPPNQVVQLSSPLGATLRHLTLPAVTVRIAALQKQHPNRFNLDGTAR